MRINTVDKIKAKPIISIAVNTVCINSAEHKVAVSGSIQPSIFPRVGPTMLVPLRNKVKANTVPTVTIIIVTKTVSGANETGIVQTRIRKKNAMPPDSMPTPTGIIPPHVFNKSCGIRIYRAAAQADKIPQSSPLFEIQSSEKLPWVATKNVPIRQNAIAIFSRTAGAFFVVIHTKIRIMITDNCCKTVAVPAFVLEIEVR